MNKYKVNMTFLQFFKVSSAQAYGEEAWVLQPIVRCLLMLEASVPLEMMMKYIRIKISTPCN